MVTEINPALCQGCGTCVAACPAGAITGTGFSNEQILAQIEGLMMLNVGLDTGSPSQETNHDRYTLNPRSSASPATGAPTARPTWPALPA